uniref:Uncharacterized protein n=1 Tax=Lygus hesperus TaxID=30085 RepID=A0A0A9X3E0_LYGHE
MPGLHVHAHLLLFKDSKVKPSYLCPASTACPSNTTKLCDLFSRLMTCCCKADFAPKPTPAKPEQRPPTTDKPLPTRPTPPMIPSPTTTQKPSSTDPWPTPPPKPSQTPTTPLTDTMTSATTPSRPSATSPSGPSATNSSAPAATTPSPTSQKPTEAGPPSTPPTSSAMSPAPLPTPPTVPSNSPSGDSPSTGKSQQNQIVVNVDSASVQDEVVDLPFETMVRRVPRKLRHAKYV